MTSKLLCLTALLSMLTTPVCHAGNDDAPSLSTAGFGQFKIGMPLESVNAHLKNKIVSTRPALRANPVCQYVPLHDFPGVAFVFIDDRLKRVDVSTPAYRSSDHVAVGDRQDAVMRHLKDAKREPLDHVPEGLTLVRETDAQPNAISYQFYDGSLKRMIAGDKRVIRYAEGCE
jgi:hypothetical protein